MFFMKRVQFVAVPAVRRYRLPAFCWLAVFCCVSFCAWSRSPVGLGQAWGIDFRDGRSQVSPTLGTTPLVPAKIFPCFLAHFCLFEGEGSEMSMQSPVDLFFTQLERCEKELFEDTAFYVDYTRLSGRNIPEHSDMPQVRVIAGSFQGAWLLETALVTENEAGHHDRQQYFAKDNKIWEWRESSNSAVVAPFGDGRNMYGEWRLFENYGIAPYRALARDNGLPWPKLQELARNAPVLAPVTNEQLIGNMLANQGAYTTGPATEEVDGAACRVIRREGYDSIWVDPACGYAIRKRIIFQDQGKHKKTVVLNKDFREVRPGLYLPMEQEVTHYMTPELGKGPDQTGEPLYHFIYRVNEYQFGTLTESARKFFNMSPLAGTRVLDLKSNEAYTVGRDGGDPFSGPTALGMKRVRDRFIRALLMIIASFLILTSVWLKMRKAHKAS
ncbi:MAG: hypothetical protein Q4G68_04010 [Planctomycetia bacterium]|nr:hypothetical protein [Planctomycetia bacterium]